MIKPMRGEVLIELLPERRSKGGLIVLSDNYYKYKIGQGTVLAVGAAPYLYEEHKKWDGKILQRSIYVGDTVEEVVCVAGDTVFFKVGAYKKYRENEKKMLFIQYADVIRALYACGCARSLSVATTPGESSSISSTTIILCVAFIDPPLPFKALDTIN